MRRWFPFVLAVVALLPLHADAAKKIRVVATIPDIADMTRQVGGDLVEVTSIATGVEDIHAVPMKPSYAVLLSRADAVISLGLEAEHAFLPALIDASRNPRIRRDAAGYIECSTYISPLEAPTRLDRSLGDQHAMGNPHINLDPVLGKSMVRAITEGLSRLYPEYAGTFRANAATYNAKLDEAIARWVQEAAPLKGKKLVSYHPDFIYFTERFGMVNFGTIEIRAGIDPTPGHIAELREAMRQNNVDFVVREMHYPAGLAQSLAQQTGAKLVELPAMSGGMPETKDYISFIDYNVKTMVKAAAAGR